MGGVGYLEKVVCIYPHSGRKFRAIPPRPINLTELHHDNQGNATESPVALVSI